MQRFIEHMTARHKHDRSDGFSLLELVVAVSIMLIIGVVGTVGYQAYTDNARQAAVDSSASEVLTAVISAENVPNSDPINQLTTYNDTSEDISANITQADDSGMTVTATSCDGTTGTATVPGDFQNLETTAFTNLTHEWLGEGQNSFSVQLDCDENVVATNMVEKPRFTTGGWPWRYHYSLPVFGGWENGKGARIVYDSYTDTERDIRDIGLRIRIQDNMPANETMTVGFDAMGATPGSEVTVYLFSESAGYHDSETFTVTQDRQRYVAQLSAAQRWSRVAIEFDNDGSYEYGDTVGYLDRLTVERGETDGVYFDGEGM